MTVVPTDATDQQLHNMYGVDAWEIIAFRRFLRVADRAPDGPDGPKVLVPEPWYGYGLGVLTGREVVEMDNTNRFVARYARP